MPVHTARRHGKAFISLRYTLMSFHIIVWAICLILTSLNVNTFLALIIIAASGVALVIYIPAAIVLCRRRSTSHFDHAGGEVAYLVTQQALSLTAAVLALLQSECKQDTETLPNGLVVQATSAPAWCSFVRLVSIPCFIQLALLIGWMAWIIIFVYGAKDVSPDEAFHIPVHRLFRGMYSGEETDVDLMEAAGPITIRPFDVGQAQARREMQAQGIPLMRGIGTEQALDIGDKGQTMMHVPPMQEVDMGRVDSRLLPGSEGYTAPPPYPSQEA